ncbi:MAG: hypothetical protein OEZ23_08820, partial [Gammaproteobacteria bacterium]|nr:hypothetical protein [Gammaproteobacteria bacterium]
AEALIRDMNKRLASDTEDSVASEILFTNYDVNGYVAGKGTLMQAVAEAAGYQTPGNVLDFYGYRQISLEKMLMLAPAVIDPGYAWDDPPALASATLIHPAFRILMKNSRVEDFPSAIWTCGLPQLAGVAEKLRSIRREMLP